MKTIVVLVYVGVIALVAARPDNVLDIDLDDMHQEQDIDDDNTITGSYYWIAPDNNKYFVQYVADDHGFRIVDSNVVPVSNSGLRADGNQGSFVSSEELEDAK